MSKTSSKTSSKNSSPRKSKKKFSLMEEGGSKSNSGDEDKIAKRIETKRASMESTGSLIMHNEAEYDQKDTETLALSGIDTPNDSVFGTPMGSGLSTPTSPAIYDATFETIDANEIDVIEEDEEENYVVLDLHKRDDLQELNKTFETIEEALNKQKSFLAGKWVETGPDGTIISKTTKTNTDDRTKETLTIKEKQSLMIDLKHILERIEKIGMLQGRKFEELEKEQDDAIATLTSIVDLEEEARISRERALEIQAETQKEMDEIAAQQAVISKELAKAEPDLLAARLAVEDINDRDLNELISLKKPPSTVKNVLTVAVWIINSVRDDIDTVSLQDSVNSEGSGGKKRRSSSRGMSKTPKMTSGANSAAVPRTRGRGGSTLSTGNRRANKRNSATNTLSASATSSAKNSSKNRGKKFTYDKIEKIPKRGRSQSTALTKPNLKNRRSKTPMSNAFDKDLAPLTETSSESIAKGVGSGSMKKSSSARNSRANSRTSSIGGDGSGLGVNRRDSKSKSRGGLKHKKSSSRIDQLKARDINKILTQDWKDTRIMLTRGNFKKRVLAFDPKMLDKKVCERIEKEFLSQEDFTVLRANQASKVLGPLVKWIRSLVGYTTIWYRIEPMANKVKSLQRALDYKKLEVRRLKGIADESHLKVIKIRSRMLKMVGYHKIGNLYFKS